ncbi:hypothetical protein [Pedobacter sp.]|jgi:hypothetical protein|uniref:hypothetical protein n=1 Tax=Pedobacter sp. TaxID=1411316 RepID=UPI002CB14FD0|nr:hypothetical protein [Pedobacter sp.]HEV3223994.1 hypothetical protein [Puia sp.]HWW42954.1 hypothetical protein [Pedobacter sp.]
MKLFLIGIIFCFQSSISYSQQADIRGVWYFDRFGGPHGEISKDSEIVKANKINKGLIITFKDDNKMISKPPGGNANNNSVVNYQVFYDCKEVIIDGETIKIMLLTSEILELYPKDESKPALFLKRSKDGKTSMSAP